MSSERDRELGRAVLAEVAARLASEGWALSERVGLPPELALGTFERPLDDDFSAAAAVMSQSPEGSLAVTGVWVGVVYEPLRRLSPLLGIGAWALEVMPVEWLPQWAAAGRRPEEWPLLRVREGNVAEVAGEVAEVILRFAVPYAQEYASVEALSEEDDEPSVLGAAVLAAAGRHAQAREILDSLPEQLESREDRRLVRQLRRWLDSGGDENLIPPEAPDPWQRPTRQPFSAGDAYRQARSTSEAREVVRAAARDLPREKQAEMLAGELRRRGVINKGPIWIDRTLDHLWDSPQQARGNTLRALKSAGRFGLAALKAIRNDDIPAPFAPPDWLQPPDRAGDLLPSSRDCERIAVTLDPDAPGYLQRAYDQTNVHNLNLVTLDAWLQAGDNDTLDVFLGQHKIGTVPAPNATRFDAAIQDAGARDEAPLVEVTLATSSHPPGFILEIPLPPQTDD